MPRKTPPKSHCPMCDNDLMLTKQSKSERAQGIMVFKCPGCLCTVHVTPASREEVEAACKADLGWG